MRRSDKQACPFRWPGQYEDPETALYYNRFRYYDPEAAAYASQEPIGLTGGQRPLAYVADPLSFADPLGVSPCTKQKSHVFWSGNGNPEVFDKAEAFARRQGGVVLEMTGRGSFLARHSGNLDWLEAKPAWDRASKLFAKEAHGDIHVFVNKAGASASSVWNRSERPILEAAQRSARVGRIIMHEI